jgi:hypothetical protein
MAAGVLGEIAFLGAHAVAFNAYYLIRASALLMEALRSKDTECTSDLLQPQLWENREGGRTGWLASDHTRRVKLAFVAYTAVLLRERDAELNELLSLGTDPNEQNFDLWWTIERFEVDQEVECVEENLGLKRQIFRD